MKKILKSTLLLLCGVCFLTACSDDNDSNPTVLNPSTFTLNTPAYAAANVDLASGGEMPFTWSQPDYGFPAPVNYQLQASLDGNFTHSLAEAEADETGATKADYATLDAVFKEAKGTMNLADLAKALQQIAGWKEAEVPAKQTVFVRASASAPGTKTIFSNTVQINTVPVYVELSDAPIELWWLIGSDIADGSWGSDLGKSIIPMQPIEGETYDKKTGQGPTQWVGYLAGGGFKLKQYPDSWDYQWGQDGDTFGKYVKNDGGSKDIKVPGAGYYTVTLNTAKDELEIVPNLDTPAAFSGMAIAGSFNDWGDTPMNACSASAENHDWYVVQHLDAGAEIKVKQADSWDYNKGGTFVTRPDGMYAFGVSNGPNLVITESADYLIIFNDITGFIRFIKQ